MISLVVPTYNERQNIETLVQRAGTALASTGEEFELIIVDDDSPDGTAAEVRRLLAARPWLKLIVRKDARDLSTAVIAGWRTARGNVLGCMDADLQHPPEVLPKLVERLRTSGADIVVASRHARGGGVSDWNAMRRFISWTATLLATVVLRGTLGKVRDPMSGFFLLRRNVLRAAALNPIGYKILLEVLAKGDYTRIEEVPFVFEERAQGGSKIGLATVWDYLIHLARISLATGERYSPGKTNHAVARLFLLFIIAVFLARVVSTYRVFNDTVDENFHIASGLELLQYGHYTFDPQIPPLPRIAVAALPYAVAGLRLPPPYSPGLISQSKAYYLYVGRVWKERGVEYYWRTLALARAGNLAFAVLTLLFVYQWGARLYGETAGLAACLIASCCPSLLAHASLATGDMAPTATLLMSCYFFWRWSKEPSWRNCLLSAVSLGLSLLSKFSVIGFLPPIAGLYLVLARWKRWRGAGLPEDHKLPGLIRLAAFTIVTAGILWAGYFFDIGKVPPPRTDISGINAGSVRAHPSRLLASALGSKLLPAPQFWQGVIAFLEHNEAGHRGYLLGKFSQYGWWYYFPIALALKSTIPILLLFGIGVALFLRERSHRVSHQAIFAMIPIVVVLGVGMMSNVNTGVRHILPLYPLLAIVGGAAFARSGGRFNTRVAIPAVVLLAWHVGESIQAHPDYLPYFNQFARGREERFLADSNLNWGQDLARLGRYVKAQGIESVADYFGGYTDRELMGINTEPLPADHPGAGWIAVAVSYQIGPKPLVKGEPVARVGKSIWIYRVDPRDPLYLKRGR